MSEDYSTLQHQGTWSLVPYDPSTNVVGYRWVYRIKHHPDRFVAWFKARLVAEGFHQEFGVDFIETFSLVAKQSTIKIVFSLAVHFNWPLQQLDVINAFLHGILQEEVYLLQTQGFVNKEFHHDVCKLQKSLYGLKQATRA